jgi:hypothetical protein
MAGSHWELFLFKDVENSGCLWLILFGVIVLSRIGLIIIQLS